MLRHIGVTDLCVGMYVQELSGSCVERPFWNKSFLIQNEEVLEKVLASDIVGAWIDLSKGRTCKPLRLMKTLCRLSSPHACRPDHAPKYPGRVRGWQ